MGLAAALLLVSGSAAAQQAPYEDEEPGSYPMMVTGIVVTSTASVGALLGGGLVLRGQTMDCTHEGQSGCPDQAITTGFGAIISLATVPLFALGIPLWVAGATPDEEDPAWTPRIVAGAGSGSVSMRF